MRSRRKGKAGEREAAALLRELYPAARRTISQARGAEDCDVTGTPWYVEVGVGARVSPHRKLAQAIADTDGRAPLVMTRRDRSEWTVTLRWEDFAALVRLTREVR